MKNPRKCLRTGSDRCSVPSYASLGLFRQMETGNTHRAEGALGQSWKVLSLRIRQENDCYRNSLVGSTEVPEEV